MVRKAIVCVLAFLLISGQALNAQGIEGSVVDVDGEAVPYASIFIKELTRGTTTNSLGMFSLPLPPGDYTIFFRSLGYTEVTKRITINDNFTDLQITLPPQTYMIPEVRVSATGEDPAYRIMRKAIGLAHYHLNQVAKYDAEIYIKGTAYFHKLPRAIARRIEVGDIKVEENRAYMLESLNEVTYRAPDKYDMRIIASQNTIPGYVERVNPMDYINASLYQPQIESFVSPLARNAFFYYEYSFEGSFIQGNHMIAKIKVIPKRKSQQVCSGFLYIVEDLWCLHSSDLVVNTIAGDLILQQQYANVIMDAWLPVSHKLDLDVRFAGVQADVTYVSSLEYKKTVLNPNLPRSYFEPQQQTAQSTGGSNGQTGTEDKGQRDDNQSRGNENNARQGRQTSGNENRDQGNEQGSETYDEQGNKRGSETDGEQATGSEEQPVEVDKDQQKIQEILAQEEISDRDMARLTKLMEKKAEEADTSSNKLEVEGTDFSIASNAVRTDSLFWNEIRPVPLTFEEKSTLVERDSLLGTGGPMVKRPRDSIPRKRRKQTFRTRDFLMGKTFRSKDRYTRFTYGGLADLSTLSYNTVDGFIYGQKFNIDHRPRQEVAYRLYLTGRYAFGRKAPDLYWNSDILYAPTYRAKMALRMYYRSEDYNMETGIPSLTNAAYSLFYRENYTKRYERMAIQIEHRMDLATGLVFYATANLENRLGLQNNSDFSLFYRNSKDYTLNDVSQGGLALPDVSSNMKLLFGQLRFEYTHEHYYKLINGRKRYFKSDYPTVFAVYKHAFPLDDQGWADYSLLYGGLHQEVEVGLLSKFNYHIEGGAFLASDETHFSDYYHFKASPLMFDMIGFRNTFLLLDHYRGSTNDYFLQAHGELNSTFLLLKLLPWFSERLWKESISFAYLKTPQVNHHMQFGYSLKEIGFLFDVGVFTAFENWKYHGTGLRFYLRF